MKKEQLAQRIGNINEELIHESDSREIYQNVHVSHKPRRMVAMVAVIALMIASFAVGAFAASQANNRDARPAEERVELDGLNVTIILPDDWVGKYGVEVNKDEGFGTGNYYSFYVKDIHDQTDGPWADAGYIFHIGKYSDTPMTPKEVEETSVTPTKFLFATEDATYAIFYTSDVQYDPEDQAMSDLYLGMLNELDEIGFILPSLISE